jgi:hypothetical protein
VRWCREATQRGQTVVVTGIGGLGRSGTLARSYVIQGMRLLVTWTNDARGRSVFWLHAAVRHAIWPSVDDQPGRPLMINSVSCRGHRQILLATFSTQNRVSAAHISFSSDTPT